jgi:5'-3' exonuclease
MHESDSELVDFYPSDIRLDINGHIYAWMGVNLIPFIESDRIRQAASKFEDRFTPEEQQRNNFGHNLVLFKYSKEHYLSNVIENYDNKNFYALICDNKFPLFTATLKYTDKYIKLNDKYIPQIKDIYISEIQKNKVILLKHENPASSGHRSKLLKKLNLPDKVVHEDDPGVILKRSFKGEEAIRMAQNILGYKDELSTEDNFRREVFDYTYNNNRAKELDPAQMEYLRKKRYQKNEGYEESNYNKSNEKRNIQRNIELQKQIKPNMYNINTPQGNNQNKFVQNNMMPINFNQFNPNMMQQFALRQQYFDPRMMMQFNQMQMMNMTNMNNTNNIPNMTNIQPNNNNTDNFNNNSSSQNNNGNNSNNDNTNTNTNTNTNNMNINSTLDNLIKTYQTYFGQNKNNN